MKEKLLAHRAWLIAAVVCFVLAVFFRCALIGYGIFALMFLCVGIVILLYLLTPKWFRILLTVVLCLGVLLFLVAEIPVVRAAQGEPEVEADYLIVLGAGVHGTTPSLSMVNRLTAAKDYLERFPACRAVLTGGQGDGESITEAEAMATWLTAHGIAAERLIPEPEATNTAENLRFSFALIPEGARVAVCSSEYHLYRAELMAADLGRSVTGVPGRTTYPVLRLNYFVREALGVVHYRVFGV